MPRVSGMVVSSDKITVVTLDIVDGSPATLVGDFTLRLPKGERAEGYHLVAQQVADFLKAERVEKVAVKASALTTGSTKLAHLHSAELRGVVMGACASTCTTITLAKATLSRTFGDRKVDEYCADDGYWTDTIDGDLKKGSREAAMQALAAA